MARMQMRTIGAGSKFLKVVQGIFLCPWSSYYLALIRKTCQVRIAIVSISGGWTLDLRGVIFATPITPEDVNQRLNAMFYIDQLQGLIILGGWIDQREQWTQAHVHP